jgi:hypothetical protein
MIAFEMGVLNPVYVLPYLLQLPSQIPARGPVKAYKIVKISLLSVSRSSCPGLDPGSRGE